MKKIAIALATTLLLFSGCSEKIVYVKVPCPKLQTWQVDGIGTVDYEVIDEKG